LHATTLAECDEVKAELADAKAAWEIEREMVRRASHDYLREKTQREQAEAELATVREQAEKWRSAASVLCGAHIGVPRTTCPVCELATVREVLEEVRQAILVPLMTSEAKRLRTAVYAALTAPPPRRTPEGDDALDDAARNLFAALCEGDGKHSEALDRRIIASHLDAYARRTTPPRRPPEPECDSCGERHLPQVMCPPHEVRRGTRNTMAVKPQGDDT
jgi:hypothetical protein